MQYTRHRDFKSLRQAAQDVHGALAAVPDIAAVADPVRALERWTITLVHVYEVSRSMQGGRYARPTASAIASIVQFRCARSSRAAGSRRSRGTPTRSRMYARQAAAASAFA